jgi:hypothetical protein
LDIQGDLRTSPARYQRTTALHLLKILGEFFLQQKIFRNLKGIAFFGEDHYTEHI